MQSIERNMSEKERDNLMEDGIPGVDLRSLTPEQKFKKELIKNEKLATSKGLPFASQAALNDKADYDELVKTTVKRQGRLPKDFKKLNMDWAKYSDLKNFKKIDESERPDTNLSNKNPGLNVMVKTIHYQFIGYDNRYIQMESASSAIQRAVKARRELDKSLN